MQLIVDNHIITEDLHVILNAVKKLSSRSLFKDMRDSNSDILVTCPMHKNGQESHPSCRICRVNDKDIPYGQVHCFSCGYSASFPIFLKDCLGWSQLKVNSWLIDNYSSALQYSEEYLPPIELDKKINKTLDEDLSKYAFYHSYMWKRKLSKEVVDEFQIGYDKDSDSIVFPVWDYNNNLVMLTKRCVNKKQFFIDKDADKPVYLLNVIRNKNLNKVYVVESQFNCLYLWTLGYPSICLFGTGSKYQYDILNHSCVRNYILMFDGDNAGRIGAEKFKKNIRNDVLVTDILLPLGKDVNDLEPDQVKELISKYS